VHFQWVVTPIDNKHKNHIGKYSFIFVAKSSIIYIAHQEETDHTFDQSHIHSYMVKPMGLQFVIFRKKLFETLTSGRKTVGYFELNQPTDMWRLPHSSTRKDFYYLPFLTQVLLPSELFVSTSVADPDPVLFLPWDPGSVLRKNPEPG
jgi:hypothetical protein